MNWQRDAEEHARRETPAEACGVLVVRRGRLHYEPALNLARDPRHGFELDPVALLGDVVAIVHSHPGASSEPSPHDLQQHAASGLDWWILGIDGWRCIPAAGALPYAGRVFRHGTVDCYTLVRDWCWRERGLLLPDYPREDDWWLRGQDLYREHFGECGFTVAALAQPCDVLLMQIGAPVPNHAAILLPGGKILHHLAGRYSGTDTYDRFYRERTTHVLRAPHDPPAG